MKPLKSLLKKQFPSLYHRLWVYFVQGGELGMKFETYYSGESHTNDQIKIPEPCLLKLNISQRVDTILDVGCASGRNFIPFNGKLKLWGIDLVAEDRIQWVQKFKDLRYEQSTLQKFTERLERGDIDLTRTLVFAAGTLAYVSKEWQKRFYGACMASGARNFIFHEYTQSGRHPTKYFMLPENQFTKEQFRKPTLAYTFYKLES